LKSKEGKDIIVYGGAGFVSALIKEELIDEFQFFINPTAIGNGMTIFNQPGWQNMTLVNAKSYDCGIVVLIYKPKNNQTLVNSKATRLGTNKVG
jgi:dihydrofolate reductase